MNIDNSYIFIIILLGGYGAWNIGRDIGKLIDKINKSKQPNLREVKE